MKKFAAAVIAVALLAPLAALASAQTKTLPGETKTVTATVEAIEASTRTVTLKGPQGNYVDVVAPPEMTKFSAIKVGDKVTARYYENIVLSVQRPGQKPVDTDATAVTKGTGAKPGATASTQRTITATITAIDMIWGTPGSGILMVGACVCTPVGASRANTHASPTTTNDTLLLSLMSAAPLLRCFE